MESAKAVKAETLGQAFQTFHQNNVENLIILVLGLTFIIGISFIGKGLLKLKEAADTNGTQVKYTEGFYRLAAGAFLVSIVSTLFMGWASLGNPYFDRGVWATKTMVKPGERFAMGDGQTLVGMAANFAIDAAGPLSTLVLALSVIIGIILVASALVSFAKLDSNGGRESFGPVAMRFFVGILLTNSYWALSVVSASFGFDNPFTWVGGSNFSELGEQARKSIFNYNPSEEEGFMGRARSVMHIAFMGLVPFGLIAFIRGLLEFKNAAEATRQASFGTGCVYLLAGVALVNGEKFACTVGNTFMGSGLASFCS